MEENVFLWNNSISRWLYHRFPINSHEVHEEIIEIHTEKDSRDKTITRLYQTQKSQGAEHLLCI